MIKAVYFWFIAAILVLGASSGLIASVTAQQFSPTTLEHSTVVNISGDIIIRDTVNFGPTANIPNPLTLDYSTSFKGKIAGFSAIFLDGTEASLSTQFTGNSSRLSLAFEELDQGKDQTLVVELIVPDSAHGTNPASASMAGYQVVTVESDKRGMVDIDKLRSIVSERTAGIMLTVPNTLGLFEKDIVLISKMVHDAGGLLYYDGANMNALLGRVRPGDMGFDIIHLNVHKTFSTPHGGGGPGAGPIGVKRHLVQYLPTPLIEKEDQTFKLNYDLPNSVGSVKSFYGNIGVLVRVYVYLLLMGRDGLKKSSELAVLASNYLLSKLDKTYYPISHDKDIMRKHEFVVSSKPLLEKGVRALDVAKKILDEGMHAPSIYFPLIVNEAIMIEPTETEPIEELDKYAEVLNRIGR